MKLLVLSALAICAAASDGPSARTSAFVPPVLREAAPPDSAVVTLPAPAVIEVAAPPVLRHAAPLYPPDFVQDSVAFLQSRLGGLDQSQADALLGPSQRRRPSYDDDGKANGSILAYSDPLHHYKEFELDFEGGSGKLRSIFVYPLKMSWRDCRRLYGDAVSKTDAGNGRQFFSYKNRRLDVLVDPAGSVVSLGFY